MPSTTEEACGQMKPWNKQWMLLRMGHIFYEGPIRHGTFPISSILTTWMEKPNQGRWS
jgi:hypothetical protein